MNKKKKVKRVLSYFTGDKIPSGAIHLQSLPVKEPLGLAPVIHHYFLVEITFPTPKKKTKRT